MYASTNINKLNISTISIVVFLVHQNQNRYNNSDECYGNTTTRPIHTLTSHILHNIHNQGIFIEFHASPWQLSAFETLLP